MTTAPQTRRRTAGPAPTFDVAGAFAYYVELDDPTYADIAAKYAVSDGTIRKWARKQNWKQRREDLRTRQAEKTVLRSLDERRRRTAKVAEKLRDRILDADPATVDLTAAIRSLPRYAQLEELWEGNATAVMGLPEVHAVIGALVAALAPRVLPEERTAALADVDGILGGIRQLEPGDGAEA